MARRIVAQETCDWHEKLDPPVKVSAMHVRINRNGKEIDLCEGCCMLFDLLMPRIDTVLQLLQPEVIASLLRAGREPDNEDSKRIRGPAQLTIPDSPPAPKKQPAKKLAAVAPAPAAEAPAADSPRKSTTAGRRKEGVEQVLCPLEHKKANSPKQYWVDVRDRGSHAKSSHDGLLGPQIPYKLPPDANFTLDVKCFEHRVCAEAGGFGFKSEAGLKMHITKADAEGWEKAPSKDATTTAGTASAAA